MKKVLTSLILVSLLAISAAPLVASAQETIPSEIKQCTMRHALTGTDWTARDFHVLPVVAFVPSVTLLRPVEFAV